MLLLCFSMQVEFLAFIWKCGPARLFHLDILAHIFIFLSNSSKFQVSFDTVRKGLPQPAASISTARNVLFNHLQVKVHQTFSPTDGTDQGRTQIHLLWPVNGLRKNISHRTYRWNSTSYFFVYCIKKTWNSLKKGLLHRHRWRRLHFHMSAKFSTLIGEINLELYIMFANHWNSRN